jgi:hypothetical protein
VSYGAQAWAASRRYNIQTAAGSVIAPLVYRSTMANVNHDPDLYEGYWDCMTQPAHNGVSNSNYVTVPFGYLLSPLPTAPLLAASSWVAGLGHSLSWNVAQPGDIVRLQDVYVKLNYLAGSTVVPLISRPLNHSATTGTQGQIINPGTNATFQCWQTSGLSNEPQLTLSGFEPKIISGTEPGATVGSPYIASSAASGGTVPYTYAIISGVLPPGLSLNTSTGVISGTPTSAGNFAFTIQVTDSATPTPATAQTTCAIQVSTVSVGPRVNMAFIG